LQNSKDIGEGNTPKGNNIYQADKSWSLDRSTANCKHDSVAWQVQLNQSNKNYLKTKKVILKA